MWMNWKMGVMETGFDRKCKFETLPHLLPLTPKMSNGVNLWKNRSTNGSYTA